MDYFKEFKVNPKDKVSLKKVNPGFVPKGMTEKAAEKELAGNVSHLAKMQALLYADNNQSLLICLQALDAAGKDGTIRHIFSGVNPQGTVVYGFKQPSAIELAHDYLWRAHARTPEKGQIAIFNRSHYEDVLVVRVHNLVKDKVWKKRYGQINDFEKHLAQNNTRILKFFLHISPEEQLARFKARLDDPEKNWKISNTDYTEREYWDSYMDAYNDALSKTSADHAPWFIIPSDQKWFRNLAISQIIGKTLEDMKLKLPPVRVDLDKIQQAYHQAAQEPDNPTPPKPAAIKSTAPESTRSPRKG